MIRKILEKIIQKQLKDTKEAAVLFSGGVDSLTCCFALENLNIKVHTYTFRLDDFYSQDFNMSKAMSNYMNWEHTEIIVPTTNIKKDFLLLTSQYHCKKKTQAECTFPLLYIFPKITEKFVLCGVGADSHYCLSKSGMMHFKEPKEKLDEFREKYFSQENPSGLNQMQQLCDETKKTLIVPYMHKDVQNYFSQFSWNELNKPFEKKHVVEDFPQFKKIKNRKHSNLQLNARIPKHFEKLLLDKELNYLNRTRVMDLVRDHSK